MTPSTLQTENLTKEFIQGDKTQTVLRDISFEFIQGKTYAITGVSGSGKSTLLHLLGGLETPTSGTVLFDKKNIFKLKTTKKEKFLNRSIGFVFQFHYLINELTVLENIVIPGLIAGESEHTCTMRALKLLEHVTLHEKAHSYPFELSGGEQQRASLLRALFNKPAFLLADEPTGNLDAANAKTVVELLLSCHKEWGMGIILCSHDKAVYTHMQQVLELKDGNVQKIDS